MLAGFTSNLRRGLSDEVEVFCHESVFISDARLLRHSTLSICDHILISYMDEAPETRIDRGYAQHIIDEATSTGELELSRDKTAVPPCCLLFPCSQC